MKKNKNIIFWMIIVTLLFFPIFVFSQINIKGYVRLHEVIINNDTTKIKPKLITFNINPLSEIIEIGKASGVKYAIRVEILESSIKEIGPYISCLILYEKVNKKSNWNKIYSGVTQSPPIESSDKTIEFLERDKNDQHNSISSSNNHGSFKIKYDLIYQWKE